MRGIAQKYLAQKRARAVGVNRYTVLLTEQLGDMEESIPTDDPVERVRMCRGYALCAMGDNDEAVGALLRAALRWEAYPSLMITPTGRALSITLACSMSSLTAAHDWAAYFNNDKRG